MMPSSLYGRRYELVLGTLAQREMAVYGNSPGTPGRRPSFLRVEFDLEKTSLSASNKGVIRITNMSVANRQNMRPGMIVSLSAGYDSQMQLLFLGGVTKVDMSRQGSELVTELEVGDAESTISQTTFDKSYPKGTRLAQVLSDMAVAMQVPTASAPTGSRFKVAVGVPNFAFSKGLTLHGPIRLSLSKLCKTFGLEWSLQSGALQIVPLMHHTGETAEAISPQTGLLGVPSFDGAVCTFGALLNARISPGRLVFLSSDFAVGAYRVRKVQYRGDTHGQNWMCEAECIPYPQSMPSPVPSSTLPIAPSPGG